ncbi:hypothetical protein ACFX15_026654 [Malus domestica]
MLDIFGEAGRVSSMSHVFKQMQEKGVKIDAVTYTLMYWPSNASDVDGAVQTWEEMKAQGYPPTVPQLVKEATDVYREMTQCGCSPTCRTCTVLMDYLIGSGKCKEALDIFEAVRTFKIAGESDSLLRQVHPHFSVGSGNQEESEFRPSLLMLL